MTAEFTFRPPRKITMAAAVSQWESWQLSVGRSPATVDNNGTFVRAWMRDQNLENARPSAITEVQIGVWINNPMARRKASSRQVALSSLRTFFRFCSAKGYCQGNPAELVEVNYRNLPQHKKERKPRVTFTEEEVQKLLAQPDIFWRAATAISRWTGLRLSDVATMEWTAVTPNRLTIWTRKTGKRIEIPVYHPTVTRIIESLPRVDEQYVFPEH